MALPLVSSVSYIQSSSTQLHCFPLRKERLGLYRLPSWSSHHSSIRLISKRTFPQSLAVRMSASTLPMNLHRSKKVWIWTECKEVMTTAVERGWNTFVFSLDNLQLSYDWSSVALVDTLFIGEKQVTDGTGKVVAAVFEVSTPEELQMLKIENEQTENIVLGLLDWKSIPAENLVAALQGSEKTVFAISSTPSEAKLYLEALEHGLGGIILKTEDVKAVLDLKDYFDKRSEESDTLSMTEATITRIQMVGMGDRVCVDLCSLMRPGEGLLVGSFARGLFLVHSECLESNYIASRPFRVNAGSLAQGGGSSMTSMSGENESKWSREESGAKPKVAQDRIDMVELIFLKPGNGKLSCSVESYMVEFLEMYEDDSVSGNGGPPRSGASTYKAWQVRCRLEAQGSTNTSDQTLKVEIVGYKHLVCVSRGTPQDLETEANKRLKGSQEGSASEQRARRR
ncbi:hypothetical protein F2Q70_00032179 [Brassica cretica]|uniref:3-dehydroquinate synthase n=1 Tax=Brassica cretica TaxID=69181 RepID=A0A8S9FIX2_BRACR|nr:hypothetical protein F2Q70_00032179 [Brassica cretica]